MHDVAIDRACVRAFPRELNPWSRVPDGRNARDI